MNVEVRVASATTLYLSVCEKHLLYTRRCQVGSIQVLVRDAAWQRVESVLRGPTLVSGTRFAPRLGVFSLAVTGAGGVAELASVSLTSPAGTELLENRTFTRQPAQWFPAAQIYFLPWHSGTWTGWVLNS